MSQITIRYAQESDIPQILFFIRELASYENMLDDVVATEDLLREWIFEKKKAEVIFAEENGESVGFTLFFHNFSAFLTKHLSTKNRTERNPSQSCSPALKL